ncbi:helix-turn-helix transcriptional regulator [Caldimonas thermodepolymerans]|uniref:helix-turn-helix domain-containing protein n=1 Tax=Caldimonas thermodepolymerans TaxID=215580 RepID=UPI001474EB49|nr:AraC family transcriptional regulator [Caldimonas thermodepolymerans]QPC31638.1 helix-turn-helix transcriptional regulator [Caldimonas thermodepolymerans]UZG44418.1 AraC family transcriptional regulator [Caldimonas thermodepolymerans]UZG48060.1 AraC family transcriptional regulator [Caldimonas thermodepolymerans]
MQRGPARDRGPRAHGRPEAAQPPGTQVRRRRRGLRAGVQLAVLRRRCAGPAARGPAQVLPRAAGHARQRGWLRASVGYALAQAQRDEAGAAAVSARVAESLFLEALRSYVEDLPMAGSGWLAGLRDPQVARCLALMHERPAHDWTVARLASQVHLGRSALAERFAQLTGQTPIAYLKKLRLTVASRLLCQEHLHLAQVAGAVGYDSESSFSRAFKAEFGMTPGQWRERFAVRRAGGVAGDAAAK